MYYLIDEVYNLTDHMPEWKSLTTKDSDEHVR